MNQFNQPQPQPPQMPPDGGAKRRLPDQSRDLGPNIAYESLLPNRFADPSFSQQQGGMGRMGGGGRGQRFDDGAYGYDLGSQVGTPLGQPQPPQMPPGGGVQRGPLEQTGVKYVPDEINNEYDRAHAIGMRSMRNPGSTTKDELAFLMDYESRKAPVQVNSNFRPQTNMSGDMGGGMGGYDGFNPMMGGIGGFQQRGTVDQNMNNPAFSMQPMPGSNELGRNLPDYRQEQDSFKKYQDMTDYQRLMQKQDDYKKYKARPPMPSPDLRRPLEGGEGIFHPPRDYEIAKSLGYADLGITDMRAKRPEEYQQEETTRQARAKSYLDSIGYGQTGFDPSKYEVKREVQPFSGIGSLFSGLGRG